MATLFLVALGLITWQAVYSLPAVQPAFQVVTRAGEQLLPVAVPAWRAPADPPAGLAARQAFLSERALPWPGAAITEPGEAPCQAFLRVSSQHWARRGLHPASRLAWQRLFLPTEAFLDDDDGDGDRLDHGELDAEGAGAEVEVFCAPQPSEARDQA